MVELSHQIFCKADPFSNSTKASYANVALKMNVNLRGSKHELKAQELGIVAKGDTMVVRVDVRHPFPGSGSKAPSIAAMSASVDNTTAPSVTT